MSPIELSIIIVVTGAMLIHAHYRQSILRDILARHGKRPTSLLFSTAVLNHIRLAKELITELDDEDEINEVRVALKRADVAGFLTIIIFLVLGIVFLITK
jgi:hypothetical protein